MPTYSFINDERLSTDEYKDGYSAPFPDFTNKIKAHATAKTYPRISKPVESIRNSYDCVVIGSGYGGSVAASRMARAGESVCVLERGQEKWPGEYPVSFSDAAKDLHYSGDLATGSQSWGFVNSGDETGLYHFIFGQGQSAMVCNGLGGGSLMNSNVFLEANPEVMGMDIWPPEIREHPGCLSEYYQQVRDMLEPEAYPKDWPELKKMKAFERHAKILGMADRLYRVPQTTRFHNGPNSTGVDMSASTLTGQDCTGVNDGSKTTTLVTYLADAWNWGAEMFCQCEVRHIEKVTDDRGGYIIYFAWHGRKRGYFQESIKSDLMWVHAKKAVFLGAGALGTTEILLRSKSMGMKMSDHVGRGMSGNGDMLAFGYDLDHEVNAIGSERAHPNNPVGPTITSVIDCRSGHDNPLDGFVIQDGTAPQALSNFTQLFLQILPDIHSPARSLWKKCWSVFDRCNSMVFGPYARLGALQKTQVFLVMSHDGSQATLSLKDDKPLLEFLGAGRSNRVKRIHALLAKAVETSGGSLKRDAFYSFMGKKQITVHPLGGARMSPDGTGTGGVTNHMGEVFVGNGTSETYPGLIVTDGAIVPAALGVNPLATIAALAERTVAGYAKTNKLVVSKTHNGKLDLFGVPANLPKSKNQDVTLDEVVDDDMEALTGSCVTTRTDLDFTELLSGFMHCSKNIRGDNRAIYETAQRMAKSRSETARLFVSVATLLEERDNTGDPQYRGALTGTFICPGIVGSPFTVLRGDFAIFKPDLRATGASNFTYDFDMTGINGRRLHFHGYKLVDSSVALNPLQLWRSTTTLYATITEPSAGSPDIPVTADMIRDDIYDAHAGRTRATTLSQIGNQQPIAMGILTLGVMDFWSEMLTLTPTGSHLLERVGKFTSFVTYFASKSLGSLLTPLAPLQYPIKTPPRDMNDTPPIWTYSIVAEDGVHTELHMWEPSPSAVATDANGDPVQIENLFMVPGAAVDHQIYSLPTIPFNAVNYLTRAGYRVFVTVHRIGLLHTARGPWTTYDARLDIKACYEKIRELYGENKIYTIAHCMGSVALSCGLLDGTIPAAWILGITCSQVFMNPIWSTVNLLKANSPIPPDKLFKSLVGHWFDCTTSANDTLIQQVLNQVLRFYPQQRHEMCSNAVCLRTSLLFGRCWSHQNLNEETHSQIERFFNGASMTLLHLLMRMGRNEAVSGDAPNYEDLTTPAHVERLRGIPFLLFSGLDSAVLSPVATARTYETLCDTFGMSAGRAGGGIQYRRRVVPGYGHLDGWMGRNAWKDVFPFVREEVDRVVRGEKYVFRQPKDRFTAIVEAGEL